MFKQHSKNMKSTESYIRILMATVLLTYAIESAYIWLILISIFLYYTAFTRFCFIYYFFNIHERYSLKNYYLSFLPAYNPSAVFIFDNKGKTLFKNGAAQRVLADIESVLDVGIDDYKAIIANNMVETVLFEYNGRSYQMDVRGIAKEQFLLAYLTDVTELVELNNAIEETQREVIYTMGEIGETRSKETGNHVKRVALYSKELALLYGLSEEEAERLKMASPMHDIGKVGIPDAILNAPRKLSIDEFEVMKTHTTLGYEMLRNSNKPILQAAATVAHEHHEKYDGSGYPQGLKGDDVHIYGRITAVADVFDALYSERVYKKAWDLDDMLSLFRKESGKHFDPQLVTLLIDHLEIFLTIRNQYKD